MQIVQASPQTRRHSGQLSSVRERAGEFAMPARAKRAPSSVRVFILGVLAALAAVVVAGFILAVLISRQATRDEAGPADAIVVLGAAQWNGKPSPVLQARLDHAYDLWTAKYAPAIIVTGGTGDGDKYSESAVARQYLIGRGIPGSALLMEQQGRTSYESMIGASDLMQQHGWRRVLLVSDPFHMLRLKRMADDLGLRSLTSPTRTSPIVSGSETEWYYKLREVATLAYYLVARQ